MAVPCRPEAARLSKADCGRSVNGAGIAVFRQPDPGGEGAFIGQAFDIAANSGTGLNDRSGNEERPLHRRLPARVTLKSEKSEWVYLYRAIDKPGKTLDFMLSERRNKAAATKFFTRALEANGLPRKIVIDKSGANTAGFTAINKMLKSFGCPIPIDMVRRKYLNNIIEQDHRFIKRRIRPMLGFKSFASAASVLAGIELANMIREGQFTPGLRKFQQFIQRAG